MASVSKAAIYSRLQKVPELNKKFNIFNHLQSSETILSSYEPNKTLSGVLVATKDNIATCDMPTTCSSKILENYVSPFDATVVRLLKSHGSLNVGKTNLDEFGMGSGGTNSAHGSTINPMFERELRSAGGSSSGSAAAVACGAVDVALGTDTGGSVRLPAAYCSIYGFKPSYGRLSRHGVIAYAQSLDTVGILGKDLALVETVFSLLDKYDSKDPTSLSQMHRAKLETSRIKDTYKFGLIKQFNQKNLSAKSFDILSDSLNRVFKQGNTFQPVSVPSIEYSLSTYYTLAPAEAVSNLSRYDGIRYGHRDSTEDMKDKTLFASTRSAFGKEVKNRLVFGNYNLSSDFFQNNYLKAQRTRVSLINEFDMIFCEENCLTNNKTNPSGVDLVVSLTAMSEAPTLQEFLSKDHHNPVNSYLNDIFTIPASLAGLPAISIPIRNTGFGLQVTGQYGDDFKVLDAAKKITEALK